MRAWACRFRRHLGADSGFDALDQLDLLRLLKPGFYPCGIVLPLFPFLHLSEQKLLLELLARQLLDELHQARLAFMKASSLVSTSGSNLNWRTSSALLFGDAIGIGLVQCYLEF